MYRSVGIYAPRFATLALVESVCVCVWGGGGGGGLFGGVGIFFLENPPPPGAPA